MMVVVGDPNWQFPTSVANGFFYAPLAKTASGLTGYTCLALEGACVQHHLSAFQEHPGLSPATC